MKPFTLDKKTRRQLKRTRKSLRKALKYASRSKGLTASALTLGGLAAFAAFDPNIRSRARELAVSARDLLKQVASGDGARSSEQALTVQAH